MYKLMLQTIKTFIIGAIALGLLLFIPAWTLKYWQAWVFIFVFGVSTNAIGIYLSLKDPVLLERRKNIGPKAEQNRLQKVIITFGILSSIGVMVFSAFDYRYGWSPVSPYISLLGDALVALGLLMDLFVFKENSFGASNIQTFEDQKVISTGLYAYVRHPMYVGVLVMIVGIPLALGSMWGLTVIAISAPVIILRILDEEKFLKKDLKGYVDYTKRVRYRLVPYIW